MASPAVTLPELLRNTVACHGHRPAVVMEDQALTYAELDAASNRMAHSLLRQGIGRGDRVALWLPMPVESFIALWGTLKAGAICVPIEPAAPLGRLVKMVHNCEAVGLVTSADRAPLLKTEFDAGTQVRAVWYAGKSADEPEPAAVRAVQWGEIEGESAEPPPVAIDGDEVAVIQYTSGSTGMPKGAMLPHRGLCWRAARGPNSLEITFGDRMPAYRPTAFVFSGIGAGAAIYPVSPRIAAFPAAVAKSWSEQRLTVWTVVPSVLNLMLKHGNLDALDLSSLRIIAMRGEVLPLEQLRKLMELLPRTRFFNIYGSTESMAGNVHEIKFPPREIDTRRIGNWAPGCVPLVLDENEALVADGAAGELWVAAPSMMRGYWGLPEKTAEVLKQIEIGAGKRMLAYRTGDLVRRLDDGGLEFLGRTDLQVKVRGFRVEIGEVEATLQRHPKVAQAVVVAVSGGTFGKRLKAVVMLRDDAVSDMRELQRHCAAALPLYMVPESIEFRSSLPIMDNGKVNRRALLAELESRTKEGFGK